MTRRQLDLNTAGFTQPMVAVMYGQIENAYQRLCRLVGDMTQAELEHRGPAGDRNSTATLIAHLSAIDLWWVYTFRGEEIPAEWNDLREMEAGPLPDLKGWTARDLLDRYGRILGMLRAYLFTVTDAELERFVPVSETGEVSLRWALWHMAEHSVLHQGHITWLRGWARIQSQGGVQ